MHPPRIPLKEFLCENRWTHPCSNAESKTLFPPRLHRYLTLYNLARLALFAVLAISLYQLKEAKPPSKTAWAKHLAQGKEPTAGEHIQVGMWYGTAARAGITGVMLLLSLAWPLTRAAPPVPSFDLRGAAVSSRTFWLVTGLIIILALMMRLPRMTHSFWGDEADAVATYIHGQFRPVDHADVQGPLRFEQPTWGLTFFSARHGPNNHVLFSLLSRGCLNLWQKFAGKDATEFTEWPLRVPALLAGLGSLATLACLLRRWGAPGLGLLAAAFMALHPWHVRYTSEARGYAFALLLLPLVLLVLTNALERRGWWHWLAFGLGEFLLMYSWAGAAYPLAFINLAAFVLILRRPDRWMLAVRWITVNLAAAAAFISLYAPHLPQIKQYNATHVWMKGLPMDEIWFHNLLTTPFTGIPYHGPVQGAAATINWLRLYAESPVLSIAGFALIVLACVVGLAGLWRRHRAIGLLVSSVFVAAIVSALHFKFIIGDELRPWYLIFTLPFLAICVAMGFTMMGGMIARGEGPSRLRPALSVGLLIVITAALWPMNRTLMAYPAEDFKGVLAATRARHEIFFPKGRAEVFTCWLWRFSALYDPRGEIHVRDEATLRQLMDEAKSAKCGLFVIVGYRSLAETQNAGMLRLLDDPALFTKTARFPAYDAIQELEVYQMNAAP